MSAKRIYGIDLGTTFSSVSYVDEAGVPRLVQNGEQSVSTPSVVYFESATSIKVGTHAKGMIKIYPQYVVESIKQEMKNDKWKRNMWGKDYNPISVSAIILEKLVSQSLTEGEIVHDVVISVPARFGTVEREWTKQAGQLAGLNVVALIPEPTAAAI